MKIDIPSLSQPPRFDPIFVTSEDLEDLSTFTGMNREACLERLKSYSPAELAQEWKAKEPKTPADILAFYRSTDLYIWELMQWHASLDRRIYWQALLSFASDYPAGPGSRVLDFGAGVGTDALFLLGQGYAVTLVDVDGPAFKFAKHRIERRGLHAEFVVSEGPIPQFKEEYEAVVCFDVFEHLSEPLNTARALIGPLVKGGILLQQASFGSEEERPCHLEAGIDRFSGLRWDIHLASLGLVHDGSMRFRKLSGFTRVVQLARFYVWKVSGLWFLRVRRN